MVRRFSVLVHTATLATAVLLPRWSAAQTTQGYDRPKDVPAKTDTSAAPTAKGDSASQGYDGHLPRVTEMFLSPDEYSRAGIRCPCRGGYCGPRIFHGCLARRTYGYPYYHPSYAAVAESFPCDCFPVLGIVYRSACGFDGAGACAYASSLPLPDASNVFGSPGKTDSSGVPAKSSTVPPEKEKPLPNNAAHLQLLVPEKAEILIDDRKTTQAGAVRQFVSPPLAPGTNFTYRITVRYRDNNGATIEDKHSIRVRANDQLRMDFTQTASPPSDRPTLEAISTRK